MRRGIVWMVVALALGTALEAYAGGHGARSGRFRPMARGRVQNDSPLAGAPRPYPYGWFGATYHPYGYLHHGYYGEHYVIEHHPAR